MMVRTCDEKDCERPAIVALTVLLDGGPRGMLLCPGCMVDFIEYMAGRLDEMDVVVSSRDERGGA